MLHVKMRVRVIVGQVKEMVNFAYSFRLLLVKGIRRKWSPRPIDNGLEVNLHFTSIPIRTMDGFDLYARREIVSLTVRPNS